MRVAYRPVIDELYPASDGKPMAETQVHVALLASLYSMLFGYFRPRGIYIAGNMFLYYQKGNPKARTAPDIMAVNGVDTSIKRRSFKTWEEKAKPCYTLELTSKKTAKEDQVQKKELYRQLRVREYFLFDPLDEYLPTQLVGFRLSNDEYEPLALDAEGGLTSKELNLRFVPDGYDLQVYDVPSGKRLLDLDNAGKRISDAEKRIAELEAELARLKGSSKGKKS